jgi:hypothetical protein
VSIYFTLIVESTENAIWLLLKSAYRIDGRPVHRLREDWMEYMEFWVRRQVGYDVQYLNEGGQT